MTLEEFKGILRKYNFRVTGQRILVFETLKENENSHLNIEKIYQKAYKKDNNIGIATIYRTLDLFLSLGILQKTSIEGTYYYELMSNKMDHYHHHLICENCKKIIEVDSDLLKSVEDKVKEKYDFIVENHELIFYGLCKICRERNEWWEERNKN